MTTSRAAWMREKKFGMMVHWCVPKTDPQSDEGIDEIADQFDLDRFIADFEKTGAEWLIFTIGQHAAFGSPNSVMDCLFGPGKCTRRDLVHEIAKRVKALGKRMIAYLATDIISEPDGTYKERFKEGLFGTLGVTSDEFYRQNTEVIREYAVRWGQDLDGWWFDGASAHPAYQDVLKGYMEAARAGNPGAAVAFNNGSLCLGLSLPVVPGQDYLAGETEFLLTGKIRYGRGTDVLTLVPASGGAPAAFGRTVTDMTGFVETFPLLQPPPNCIWHALIPIDCMWGRGIPFNTDWQNPPFPWVPPEPGKMEKPLYTVDDLEGIVRDFKDVGGGATFNVGIFPEGSLGPDTVDQLTELAGRL